ncbi:hypothetical protein T06_15728 [Trichinella sp. T6]|nr:hypothetical protein T06_15728 [Trichinella sp. T6]
MATKQIDNLGRVLHSPTQSTAFKTTFEMQQPQSRLLAVSNHRFSSLKRWSVRGFPTINTQHLLRVTTCHGQRIAVNVIRRRGQRDSFSQEMTVRIRLSPVRLMTCSRYLRPISLLGRACRQLWTKRQSEKHRHEALNASKGSPDEYWLHSLDTMAERVRHDDKDTASDCSRKVHIAVVAVAEECNSFRNWRASSALQTLQNCSIITFLMRFKWYCAMWKPESATVPLRLSPVRLTACSRYLWRISLLGGACCQLRTRWQSEKHGHEALNASKGSPDEHWPHSLDTMAERIRHDDKDTTSDC